MSEFEMDFEWPVATRYDFQPATDEEVSKWRHRPQILREMQEREWPLYFGRIVPSGEVKDRRPKKDELEYGVQLLIGYENLPFHKVALKVARALGAIRPEPDGDSLLIWYELACDLRSMFENMRVLAHPEEQLVGDLGLFLVPVKGKRPMLALRPVTLEGALKLCASRMITKGTAFNICENCKSQFLTGGGRGRNKKRGDARFCSYECRYRYHNESRRKAR